MSPTIVTATHAFVAISTICSHARCVRRQCTVARDSQAGWKRAMETRSSSGRRYHLLRWRGHPGVRGVLDGEPKFRLHPLPEGGTRFTQSDSFTGVLDPLVTGVLDDTRIWVRPDEPGDEATAGTAPPPATT